MSPAVLAPAAARRPQLLPRRRLEHAYPLFGFRRQVLHMPLAHRHADIHSWLLRQARSEPSVRWSLLWARCRRECPSCFKEIWVVRLPRRSRRLQPGDYAFDPLTDFLHIPGNPPPVVQDCYREAFAELPRHRFVYLDLLWDTTPGGLELIPVERLRASIAQQELSFKRRLRIDRLLIEAARDRLRTMVAKINHRGGMVIPAIRPPSTPVEARRILGLTDDALERSLQVQTSSVEFTKYDPVIVFEEPALLARAGGHMPLGLIAHWD